MRIKLYLGRYLPFLIAISVFSSCKTDENILAPKENPYKDEWTLIDTTNSNIPWGGAISIDFENNIAWLVSYPGNYLYSPPRKNKITRYDGTNWVVYNQNNSYPIATPFWKIKVDKGGKVYVGTETGLFIYSNNIWATEDFHSYGSSSSWIYSVSLDDSNNIWVGTSEGLFKYNQLSWKQIKIDSSEYFSFGYRLVNVKKDLFVAMIYGYSGTSEALYYRKGSTVKIFDTTNSILPERYINTIAIDNNNAVWVGSNDGLFSYDGLQWTKHGNNFNSRSNLINVIKVDKNNVKWIGTDGSGVLSFDGNNWQKYDDPFGLGMNGFIEDIGIDDYNNKWLCTLNGILILNK